MGTLGVRAGDEQITMPGLTTLDAADMARQLADLAKRGVTHVALEASSHGVSQRRLDGVRLSAAGFLKPDPGPPGLSRDHGRPIASAKLRLFEDPAGPRGGTAVLNADSEANSPVFAAGGDPWSPATPCCRSGERGSGP